MPERIQMSRQHPWRAEHPDAIRVDRATRWGNPWSFARVPPSGQGLHGERWAVWDLDLPSDTLRQLGMFATEAEARAEAIRLFRMGLDQQRRYSPQVYADLLRPLVGRDLACWCPLDQPCHADVLLEIANVGQELTPADLEPACDLCRRVGGHAPTCLAVLAGEIEAGDW